MSLDGLSEAHLVGEYAVEESLVEGDEPVEADVLVLAQRVLQQERHRRLHRRRVQRVARRLEGLRHLDGVVELVVLPADQTLQVRPLVLLFSFVLTFIAAPVVAILVIRVRSVGWGANEVARLYPEF